MAGYGKAFDLFHNNQVAMLRKSVAPPRRGPLPTSAISLAKASLAALRSEVFCLSIWLSSAVRTCYYWSSEPEFALRGALAKGGRHRLGAVRGKTVAG